MIARHINRLHYGKLETGEMLIILGNSDKNDGYNNIQDINFKPYVYINGRFKTLK